MMKMIKLAMSAVAVANGVCTVSWVQDFDTNRAPFLPFLWTTSSKLNSAFSWFSTTSRAQTAPNSAFVAGSSTIKDESLYTPHIFVNSPDDELSFLHYYDLEEQYDGAVLEISVNDGTFVDILDPEIGASFVTGGYTAPIAVSFANPLAGRQTWTGKSETFVPSIVKLGSKVNQQHIRLRFRYGSDYLLSSEGWYVDSMRITTSNCTHSPFDSPELVNDDYEYENINSSADHDDDEHSYSIVDQDRTYDGEAIDSEASQMNVLRESISTSLLRPPTSPTIRKARLVVPPQAKQ